MQFLERASVLDRLAGLLAEAQRGRGALVFVGGEAGIGKTTLLSRFADTVRVPVLWGNCDALHTPSTLGPLRDIARHATLLPGTPSLRGAAALAAALRDGNVARVDLNAALIDLLGAQPLVAVFEDVHWADEATLDLLRYLGRRMHRTPSLALATYRDDELGPAHPLRTVLGDLASQNVARVSLPPLSLAAVRALASDSGLDADQLHARTGGNPFFVTEVIAAGGAGIPATVRDAVAARAARLGESARAVLDAAAVAGPRVEPWLLEHLAAADTAAVDDCVAAGVMLNDGGVFVFRHELARQAILAAQPPHRRIDLHRRALKALDCADATIDVARLVHHAAFAHDTAAVLRFAPAAARDAALHGAHREAAAHYATALAFAQALPPAQRADLVEARAYECYLVGDIGDAVAARESTLALWRETGNRLKEGDNLRWLSRLHWFLGHGAQARRYAEAAVETLEGAPPGVELAMACSNRSQLHMLAEEADDAIAWGRRAIELAERLDATEILSHALNNVGTSLIHRDDAAGLADLERSLALALEHRFEEHAARAYCNLGSMLVAARRYALADEYLAAGIEYCTERDLDSWLLYLLSWRARARLDAGRWEEAAAIATALVERDGVPAISRTPALAVLGCVRTRRGDPGATALLDEALALARSIDELQRVWPVAMARAESAWLAGDAQRCAREARACYDLARTRVSPWALGESACWLVRAGERDSLHGDAVAETCALPHALELRGDWRGAAAAWDALGCPYERALCLAHGDAAAVREALALLDRLGARPAAQLVRGRMRAAGDRSVPRGPRASTRANEFGLTARELDILALLSQGLSNAQIGARRHISVRTVDHHVAAILGKLGVASRAEAAQSAARHRLVGAARAEK